MTYIKFLMKKSNDQKPFFIKQNEKQRKSISLK
jgi:hypothetical protein